LRPENEFTQFIKDQTQPFLNFVNSFISKIAIKLVI